jgi:hypothetical protein
VEALVKSSIETPLAGVLGAARVNVLRLNLALDEASPREHEDTVSDASPDPDALLRSLAQNSSPEREQDGPRKGRLKVFLGAAPGVGKTCEMLSEAAQRRDMGEDVVIGVIETHGRAETEARMAGFEIIPVDRSRIAAKC